jgi:hypothetical protein
LFGDQKSIREACPDPTDFTNLAYHHSSAKGTLTPFSRIKARVKRAAIAQRRAAANSRLAKKDFPLEPLQILYFGAFRLLTFSACNLVSQPTL